MTDLPSGVESLLQHYQIGEVIQIKELESGYSADNYYIRTNDSEEFVIKFIHDHYLNVSDFMRIYQFLSSRGIPCASPIKTRSGSYVVPTNDEKERAKAVTGVILTYLPGEEFGDADINTSDPKYWRRMGQMLGLIHNAGRKEEIQAVDWYHFQVDDQNLLSGLEMSVDRIKSVPSAYRMDEIESFIGTYFGDMPEVDLSISIIHQDLQPNCFLVEDEEITGILDFNAGNISFSIIDLSIFLRYLGRYDTSKMTSYEREFFRSYLKVAPTRPEELEMIPIMTRINGFHMAAYRAWRLTNNYSQGGGENADLQKEYEDAIDRFLDFDYDSFNPKDLSQL